MIQLIEGPPRSGKSYYACNYINKFCKFDALYSEYILKDDVLIISNIEGLKVKHWTLHHCLNLKPSEPLASADRQRVKDFFSISNFENIQKTTRKNHIILVIDEAHEIFPAGMREPSIYEFFAFHGHIGLDVFLMTQGIESLSRMFNPLFEHIVKVTPRSKKVLSSFTYRFHDKSGKFLYPQVVKKQKLVFGIYKSFRKDEFNKPKSAVMIWSAVVLAIFIAAGVMFKFALGNITKGNMEQSESVQVEKAEPVLSQVKKSVMITDGGYVSGVAPVDTMEWRTYPVQGFVDKSGSRFYMIYGLSVPASKNTRAFDDLSMTVQYYGYELKETLKPSRRSFGARSEVAVMTADLGSQAKPVGVAVQNSDEDKKVSFVDKPDYFTRSKSIKSYPD